MRVCKVRLAAETGSKETPPPQKVHLFWNVLSQSVEDMELLTNEFNISFNNRMMDSSAGSTFMLIPSIQMKKVCLWAGGASASPLD